MNSAIRLTLLAFALALIFNAAVLAQTADVIYHNGSILTMAGAEATYVEALAVKDGKIAFAGSKSNALKMKGDVTKIVDLGGKTLLPGFIDGHSHYINSLLVADQCKLYAPPSGPGKDVPSIIAELKRYATERKIPKGEMIMGYGYDDTVMPGGRLLNRDDLDEAFPDNPVRIEHVSMHGVVLNSLALKYYDISAETETPAGGVIVRKPGTKEPWGLIMETAFLPVVAKSEPMTAQREINATRAGQMLYAENGVTTAHEGATHFPQIQTIQRASDAGANIIDVVAYPFITDADKVLAEYPLGKWTKYENRFKLGGVKITLDGSPQGRTAFFTTPYLTGGPSGEKNWKGEPTFPQDLANKMFKKVYDMNVPLDQMMMLYSAVNRISRAGAEIGLDQRVTPYEGLKCMTEWAAEQYGEQASKGTLEAGKRADLVILNKDPLQVDPKAIKDIKVVETIKDGVSIFPAPAGFEKPLQASSKYAGMSYMWRAHVCDMAEVNQAAGKEWILVSLNGKPVATDKPPTMKFERGKLAIFGGVNRMSGSYALIDNGSITLGQLVSTKMAGPSDLMELERNFSEIMVSVNGFHVRGNELQLLSEGRGVAEFRARE